MTSVTSRAAEVGLAAGHHGPLRVGIGGPVGSGKTALVEALCKRLRHDYDIYVITNDIYTKEDQLILTRAHALPAERIMGIETGGCPHAAIREDASMNLAGIEEMNRKFPQAELCFIESGGDNLAATFSPELADLMIYVIDVAEGEKIPRKGGPGITRSDFLVINKIDLAPLVGASLGVMEADTRKMRGKRPFAFTNLKHGHGVEEIVTFIIEKGGLTKSAAQPEPESRSRRGESAMPDISLDIAEIEDRIAIVRANLRELVEQAAGYSGAADEDLTSRRITEQEAQLERLTMQRDALLRRKS